MVLVDLKPCDSCCVDHLLLCAREIFGDTCSDAVAFRDVPRLPFQNDFGSRLCLVVVA